MEDQKDLFEYYDELPDDVQAILAKYEDGDASYKQCKKLQDALDPLGFTFDWGLDAAPFNLRRKQ